jgi:hypothetical protein
VIPRSCSAGPRRGAVLRGNRVPDVDTHTEQEPDALAHRWDDDLDDVFVSEVAADDGALPVALDRP